MENYTTDANSSPGLDNYLNSSNWDNMSSDLDFAEMVNYFEGPSLVEITFPVPIENPTIPASSTNTCCVENNNCPTSGTSGDDRTPCSAAFELIRRCNSKRLDMVEICVR